MRAVRYWLLVPSLVALATLAWARDLTGVVLDPTGARVAGAEVSVSDNGAVASRLTGSDGSFRFSDLGPATVHVAVRAPGFTAFQADAEPGVSTLEITLRAAGAGQEMLVTATRTETVVSDTPADVRVIDSAEISADAGTLLDDALRKALGFSLFRRSGARFANPTSQGVSLRGVGASGASRALVLYDGVPLNDPFGGWVQWDRVPALALQDAEVVRGGASDLYGADALSGVIGLEPRQPAASLLDVETSAGSSLEPEVSAFGSLARGPWQASGALQSMRSPGYILVSGADRGAVDRPASLDFTSGDLRLARKLGTSASVFGAGSLFSEARGNGTVLQTNSTHLGELIFGADKASERFGNFALRAYDSGERYHQSFSAIAPGRGSEILTRLQRVPASGAGASLQWDRAAGERHHLVAGFEWRNTTGVTQETVFVANAPFSFVTAGGRSDAYGWFAEDYARLGSRWLLTGAVRGDLWTNVDGRSFTQPLSPAASPAANRFADRSAQAVSPRVAAQFAATQHVALSASVYRSFRPPTLNELYRAFRIGNVLTLANPDLQAERLTGGEAGVNVRKSKLAAHATFFWAQVDDPVANATLSVTPALITRQRQNLGATRARGLELEAEWQWRRLFVAGGYQWTDSVVLADPANPAVVGLDVPQVPAHQFTASLRYLPTSRWTLAAQLRGAGVQFDDDLNQLPLDPYTTLDLYLSRRINSRLEALVAAENALDQRYVVGRTPVATFGPPALLRAGLRLRLGAPR